MSKQVNPKAVSAKSVVSNSKGVIKGIKNVKGAVKAVSPATAKGVTSSVAKAVLAKGLKSVNPKAVNAKVVHKDKDEVGTPLIKKVLKKA